MAREGSTQERAALLASLPQCRDWLLVDAVTARGPDWLEARWTVPEDFPAVRRTGADPPRLVPGSITLEHVVQAGELLVAQLRGPVRPDDGAHVLSRVRAARFTGMVRPGDALSTRATLTDQLGPAYDVRAEVRARGEVVARLRLAYTASAAIAAVTGAT